MTKLIVIALYLLFGSALVACVQPNNHEEQEEQETSSVNTDNKTKDIKIKKSNLDTLTFKKQTGKTVLINYEKYLFTGEKLKKGSELRNIHMSEKATVKGTFVIIVKPSFITNEHIEKKILIAKNTYRLIPKKADDLLLIYHDLLSDVTIEKVELELLYGKIKNNKLEN